MHRGVARVVPGHFDLIQEIPSIVWPCCYTVVQWNANANAKTESNTITQSPAHTMTSLSQHRVPSEYLIEHLLLF